MSTPQRYETPHRSEKGQSREHSVAQDDFLTIPADPFPIRND
jgi:hypothetical protein